MYQAKRKLLGKKPTKFFRLVESTQLVSSKLGFNCNTSLKVAGEPENLNYK